MKIISAIAASLLAASSLLAHSSALESAPAVATPMSQAIEDTPFITPHKPNPHAQYYMYFFTASWCSPCRAVMPKIIAEYPSMMTNRHMEVILVSLDDSTEQALSYLSKCNAPFAAIMHSSLKELAFPGCPAEVNAIPHIIVVDNHGRFIYRGHALRYSEWKSRTAPEP